MVQRTNVGILVMGAVVSRPPDNAERCQKCKDELKRSRRLEASVREVAV
jgi:hypothetical protein